MICDLVTCDVLFFPTLTPGVKGPTILVLTAESQQQLNSAGSNLISRFNQQLKEIMSTLAGAEQEIKQQKKDEEEQKADNVREGESDVYGLTRRGDEMR